MLTTPFGNIKIEFDGQETDYEIREILPNKRIWPDVAQGFLLRLRYIPDCRPHILRCVRSQVRYLAAFEKSVWITFGVLVLNVVLKWIGDKKNGEK